MKKHIKSLFILFTFLSSFFFSQQNKIDSLFSELKKWEKKSGYEADTTLYNIYYNLGVQFQKSNPDTAIYFLKQSIFKARNIKDAIKEAESVRQTGWCYYVKGNYSKAMEVCDQALKTLPEKLSEKDIFRKQKVYAAIIGSIGLVYMQLGNYSKALDYYFRALKVNEEIGNKKDQATVLGNIGNVYYYQGNYAKSMEYYFKAMKINKEIGDKGNLASNLGNIGIVYHVQGNYSKSLEYYFRALKINEEIGNKQGQAINLGNIGIVYKQQGNYSKALEYYFRVLKIFEEIGDKRRQAAALGNIGNVYKQQGNYSKALEYYFRALKINEEIGNKKNQAVNLGNIGGVYSDQHNYSKALEYYFKAQRIDEEIGNKKGQTANLGNIGYLYIQQKKYKEAEEYLKKAIAIGEELHDIYNLAFFYNSLSELYSKTERYKQALEAYQKHVIYKDSVNKEENQKALVQKEMQYEFERKQEQERSKHQLELTKKDEENKRQKIIILASGLLLVTMSIFLWRINNQRKIIKRQKEIVEEQKKLVEEKNKEITDSIHYAKRIQQAILPDDNEWKKLLPDSFVLYLPKDIVVGDFYWLVETDNYIYVAVADCTGHGVPGAMVSVTCHNALNKAVLEEGLQNTNEILNRTREIVIKQLHAHQHTQLQDGMDICLVRINKNNRLQIQYSGANRPLVVVCKGELVEYVPDKQPIGYYEDASPFKAQEIELVKGSYLYLFTDGYADQFGGEKGKKIGTKRWKEVLRGLEEKGIEEQEEYLRKFFDEWRGKEFQIDDVTVVGIRC